MVSAPKCSFFVKCVNGVFLPCEHFLHPETCGSCHQEPVPPSPAPQVSVPSPMVSLSPQAPTPSDGATVPSRRWCYCPCPWWMPSPVGSQGHRPCPHTTSSPTRSQCRRHPRLSPHHYRNRPALFAHGAPLLWGGWQQKRGGSTTRPRQLQPPQAQGVPAPRWHSGCVCAWPKAVWHQNQPIPGGKSSSSPSQSQEGGPGGPYGVPSCWGWTGGQGGLRHGSRTGSGVFDLERFVHLLALTAEPLRGRGGYRMPVAPPQLPPPLQTVTLLWEIPTQDVPQGRAPGSYGLLWGGHTQGGCSPRGGYGGDRAPRKLQHP